MSIQKEADCVLRDLQSLNAKSELSEAACRRVLAQNAALIDAANDHIQSNEQMRQTLEDITALHEQLEKKFKQEIELNAAETEQKRLITAQRDFRNIVLEIRDGRYSHGDCKASNRAVMDRLCSIPYPHAVLVYRGSSGRDKCGYSCVTKNSAYVHHWKDGKCYVAFQCAPEAPTNSSFQGEAESASKYAIKKWGGKSCVDMASHIMKHLNGKDIYPKFVIVKKEPGGFDNWAYSSFTHNAYHKWHSADDGSGVRKDTKYGVGIHL